MRLTADQLRGATLARQFPRVRGRGRAALVDLADRVGPIQSQVPRSPFLAASSRLPGIDHAVVRDAFAGHDLVKTTSLRGTVHTTTRAQYPWVDAVSRAERAKLVRRLFRPTRTTPEQLFEALERFTADDWRERSAVVDHARDWLAAHESAEAAASLGSTFADNLVWGHSGLLRRPKDAHWDRRTDTWHRDARAVLGGAVLPRVDLPTAVRELTRVHLAAFGPATEADIAWWLGVGLTPVRQALAGLGDEVRTLTGPDDRPLLDLAGQPLPDHDPGLRLLGEFDSLMLGYHGDSRDRFLDREHQARIWSKSNGVWVPAVLHRQRLVASWRTVAAGTGRARIEITPFTRDHGLTEDALDGPVADTARVLALDLTDVAVRAERGVGSDR